MITRLGQSESFMLFGASGAMEQLERVHISKGTRIYAFGYAMNEQEYVVYDENMHAVEICNGNPADIDESDLDCYFSPLHTLDEETRPISKKFGIGFYYDESNEVISDEVIAKSLQRAENIEKLRKEVEQRKADEKEALRTELAQRYNYLQRVTSRFDHKTAGANIRTELKREFPRIKFVVRYSSFSGGDEYSISWEDGPTIAQVDAIVRKYGDMHPDTMSMGDYWDCVPSVFNDLFGSVGYVMTHRSLSDDAKERTMHEHKCDVDEARRILHKTDLTPIAEPKQCDEVAAGLEIIDYSERAIVVVGDTRAVKDELKRMGGTFNKKLRCGAGWVFPKSKRENLEAFIS